MKIELFIDKEAKLPDGAVPVLEKDLQRRLSQNYDDVRLSIRRVGSNGLSVIGVEKTIKSILKKSS